MCDVLKKAGFEAVHVDLLPEGDETPDEYIRTFADENDLTVVTKDSDFYYSHMIRNQPKKLFLITTGNIKNRNLFDLIRSNASDLKELITDCNYIEMSNEELFGH
jgi:predicted nuclease of predicted toxin-antitoxin system